MSDIFSDPKIVEYREKIRAYRIQIENPLAGEKRIEYVTEKQPFLDGEPLGESQSAPWVSRNFSDVITETVTVVDPVTSEEITVSVAGIATLVESAFVKWYNEDVAATMTPDVSGAG